MAHFTSWDGLEAYEIDEIKAALRDIENAHTDSAKKRTLKRSAANEEKKIKAETIKLMETVRECFARPRQTKNTSLNLNADDRKMLRNIYMLVQEGLQNPVVAMSPEFQKQLRELCQQRKEIGTSGPDEIEEAVSEVGTEDDRMDDVDAPEESQTKDGDRRSQKQLGGTQFVNEAALDMILDGPLPDFDEIQEGGSEDDEPVLEELAEFHIADEIRAEFGVLPEEEDAGAQDSRPEALEVADTNDDEEDDEEDDDEDNEEY